MLILSYCLLVLAVVVERPRRVDRTDQGSYPESYPPFHVENFHSFLFHGISSSPSNNMDPSTSLSVGLPTQLGSKHHKRGCSENKNQFDASSSCSNLCSGIGG